MTADDFVTIVRNGSDKLRIDDVVIKTDAQIFRGKGMLQITQQRIEATVAFGEGQSGPKFSAGVYTKRDAWTLTGLIEDNLQFQYHNVGPVGNEQISWPGQITKCTLKLDPIDLVPSGWDAMSRHERDQCLKPHQENEVVTNTGPAEGISADELASEDVTFYATIFEYALPFSSCGKEIRGETENYEYILTSVPTKNRGASDLGVTLHFKSTYRSNNEQGDWSKFYSFMHALAFMSGVHAWPYRIEYWRAGQKTTDRVTAANCLCSTVHIPFSDQLAFGAVTGSVKWSFQQSIRRVVSFFETDSPLSKEIEYLLFLFRQGGAKGVHHDVRVIAMCVLFENLVRLIFRELKLEDKARNENPVVQSFEAAKKEVLEQLVQQLNANSEGYKRLRNIVQSAEAFNVKQMIQTIGNHFGLKWEADMELLFKTWNDARHLRVHRGEYSTRSEDNQKASIIAESRIAGAINILLLKLFGYSGIMNCSIFEDRHRQI